MTLRLSNKSITCRTKFFNILSVNETIERSVPTPTDLYLTNTTLKGTYQAQNSITVESNVTVTGKATLIAGNSIDLKPGFVAPNNSNFTAFIRTVSNTPKRYYYSIDHLGSIRVVVNEAGDIVSSDDYDPWGMILEGRTTNNDYVDAKYKFTGKERDIETGYLYFGARYYDSRIGRWLVIDPLFEKHPEWSPYNYVLNNPIILIDPNGKQILISDPFFNYGFSKGFLGTLERSVTGLYETVAHPIATGEQMLQAITHPGVTLEVMGSVIGNWAGRFTSTNPIESGEAFGEATAFIGETLIGTKGVSKISSLTKFGELSKLSTVGKLMSGVEKFTSSQLKMFEKQFAESGIKSLLESKSSLSGRLAEHLSKLEDIKVKGGYTSSIEKGIRNFQQQLNAVEDVLRRNQ